MVIVIKGNNSEYTFNPEDKNAILKMNGKFGSSYIGICIATRRKFVIKQLAPSLQSNSDAVNRFYNELNYKFSSTHILKATDGFKFDDEHYLIRPYFEGESWRSFSKKKQSLNLQILIALKCLNAIAELHQHNIIHRDIRPDNFLICKTDDEISVKLIDLGLSVSTAEQVLQSPFSLIYSPPEQILQCHKAVDYTSDLYSFAVSLYEMLSGVVPFYHENPELMMHLQINTQLKLHKFISAEIMKLLHKATFKHRFALPPNKYSKTQLMSMLIEANKKRYHNADEFILDMTKLI